jgi:3-hydroxyisobutyrate dehydrogenase/2-hydroxy-3-oxopropionate reductase
MGQPMVRHLLAAGYALRVFARRPEVLIPFVELGAVACVSPAQAAETADIVITNVTNSEDVREVLLGAAGVIHGAQAGTVCIDHSTIDVAMTREIAQKLAEAGIEFLDAPVSGGVKGAKEANLSIMVGGKAEILARVHPILSCLGASITHIGDVGCGQIAKACNQTVQVITIQGVAEALHYAKTQGADLDRVLQAISAGMAGSKMLDLMGPKMAARDFSAGIRAKLHAKDFELVRQSAIQIGLHLPALEATSKQLTTLMNVGLGESDTSALLCILEKAIKN